MGNAAFILFVGALMAWLWGTGKLQNILNVVRGQVDTNKSGPLYGGQGLLFG